MQTETAILSADLEKGRPLLAGPRFRFFPRNVSRENTAAVSFVVLVGSLSPGSLRP